MYLVLLAGFLSGTPARALETDQFYAWGKPIEDSAEYLNAWVQLTIQSALDSRSVHAPDDCESAVDDVQKHLQHSIFQPIELWVFSSDLVDRIPRGYEANRDYRSQYLLSRTFPLDYAHLLPPSPTLQVNGVRFGSDKLAHFFSEGWWYYKYWRKNRDRQTPEELRRNLFQFGVKLERSIQGSTMSGVFSPADLEANYQGFIFYRQLCHGDEPLMVREDGRWYFSERFDFRDYIYPKWDESWNPNIYSERRWEGISNTMARYCPDLKSAWVQKQRAYYAGLDGPTPTGEQVKELVAGNELADPRTFDITTVCGPLESSP
jgi:hypothetical protein